MPTKRAVLAELTRAELRANLDYYELAVDDRCANIPIPPRPESRSC